MKFLITACVLLAGLAAFSTSASGQSWGPGSAKIGKVEVEIQETPVFQAGNVKDKKVDRPRDWVEMEVEFELSDRVQKEGFVEKVMIRYYVVVKGAEQSHMLVGDVTHINVPTGEDVYSIAYIPPAVITRVKGEESKVPPSDIQAVGISIFVNGVEIAREGVGQKSGWWLETQLQQESGVLAKSKTPFSILWIDRHAEEDTTAR